MLFNNSPRSWSNQRLLEYFTWSDEHSSGCFGPHLRRRFDPNTDHNWSPLRSCQVALIWQAACSTRCLFCDSGHYSYHCFQLDGDISSVVSGAQLHAQQHGHINRHGVNNTLLLSPLILCNGQLQSVRFGKRRPSASLRVQMSWHCESLLFQCVRASDIVECTPQCKCCSLF